MTRVIGLDLGGTNLRAGLVDPDTGAVLESASVPTLAREGNESVIRSMTGLIGGMASRAGQPVRAIGIGVPGVLDLERGAVLFLPNFPGNWRNVKLADAIRSETGIPVFLLNDARAITYGEWSLGAGRCIADMACFTLGTGIGGGLILDGQLRLGIGGTAGELGHIIVDLHGLPCGCGNRGCVEAYASGPAIAAKAIKAVTQGLTTNIGALAGHDLNRITPELVCQAALAGDAVAREIYEEAGHFIGIAAASLLVSVGLRRIVLAGGVAQAGELLFSPVRRTIRERVKMMPVDQVDVVPATLGSNGGILGSALWALRQCGNVSVSAN
jgi:glucokinase